MWLEQRWAWSLCQIGFFVLAGWKLFQKHAYPVTAPAIVLALGGSWPLLQLAVGVSISRRVTEDAALNWWSFLVVFLLGSALPLPATAVGTTILAGISLLAKFTSHGRIL